MPESALKLPPKECMKKLISYYITQKGKDQDQAVAIAASECGVEKGDFEGTGFCPYAYADQVVEDFLTDDRRKISPEHRKALEAGRGKARGKRERAAKARTFIGKKKAKAPKAKPEEEKSEEEKKERKGKAGNLYWGKFSEFKKQGLSDEEAHRKTKEWFKSERGKETFKRAFKEAAATKEKIRAGLKAKGEEVEKRKARQKQRPISAYLTKYDFDFRVLAIYLEEQELIDFVEDNDEVGGPPRETKNFFRDRQFDPSDCIPGTYKQGPLKGTNKQAVWCKRKSTGKIGLQSILTPKSDYIEDYPDGVFISIKLSDKTEREVRFYQKKYLNDYRINEKLHSTLIYSKKPHKGVVNAKEYQAKATFKEFALFGEEKDTLVMRLNSEDLTKHNKELVKQYGFVSDYDSYEPHLTLVYGIGKDFDLKSIPEPTDEYEFIFENETVEPLDESWNSDYMDQSIRDIMDIPRQYIAELEGVLQYHSDLTDSLDEWDELPTSIRMAMAVDSNLNTLKQSNPDLEDFELLRMAYDIARSSDKDTSDFIESDQTFLQRVQSALATRGMAPTLSGTKPLRPKFPKAEYKGGPEFFVMTAPLSINATGGKTTSTNIAEIGYDQGRAIVFFNNGWGYEYDVSPDEYKAFAASQSKGEHLWQFFRGKKPGRVIDNPKKETPGGVGGSIVPYFKVRGNRISTASMRKNIRETYTELKEKGVTISKIRKGAREIAAKLKKFFGGGTPQDFYEFEDVDIEIVSDFKTMYGRIVRAGDFPYFDKKAGKEIIRKKDYQNLKDVYSKQTHLPLFDTHNENKMVGFAYGFEPHDDTKDIWGYTYTFDDVEDLSSLREPDKVRFPVSARYIDVGEGEQQHITDLIHLAISLNATEQDRCSAGGRTPCYVSIKSDFISEKKMAKAKKEEKEGIPTKKRTPNPTEELDTTPEGKEKLKKSGETMTKADKIDMEEKASDKVSISKTEYDFLRGQVAQVEKMQKKVEDMSDYFNTLKAAEEARKAKEVEDMRSKFSNDRRIKQDLLEKAPPEDIITLNRYLVEPDFNKPINPWESLDDMSGKANKVGLSLEDMKKKWPTARQSK